MARGISKIKKDQRKWMYQLERKYGDCLETMHQVMAGFGEFNNVSNELRFAAAARIAEYKYNKRPLAAADDDNAPSMIQISFLDDAPYHAPVVIDHEAQRVQ